MYVEDCLAFTQVNVIMWLESVYVVRLLISDDNHMIAVVSVLTQLSRQFCERMCLSIP